MQQYRWENHALERDIRPDQEEHTQRQTVVMRDQRHEAEEDTL